MDIVGISYRSSHAVLHPERRSAWVERFKHAVTFKAEAAAL
jgi:hypothetical protein